MKSFQAIVGLSNTVRQMSSESAGFVEYCKALSRLLGEVAEVHFPNVMYADKPEYKDLLQAFIGAALYVISIQVRREGGSLAIDWSSWVPQLHPSGARSKISRIDFGADRKTKETPIDH